jgi:hypothetical protein
MDGLEDLITANTDMNTLKKIPGIILRVSDAELAIGSIKKLLKIKKEKPKYTKNEKKRIAKMVIRCGEKICELYLVKKGIYTLDNVKPVIENEIELGKTLLQLSLESIVFMVMDLPQYSLDKGNTRNTRKVNNLFDSSPLSEHRCKEQLHPFPTLIQERREALTKSSFFPLLGAVEAA